MIVCAIEMTAKATLPCGCVMRNSVAVNLDGSVQQNDHAKQLPLMLNYWIDSRVKHHRCELVSEVNPNGLTTQAKDAS